MDTARKQAKGKGKKRPRPSDGGAKGEGQDGATGSGMANAMAQLLGTRLSAAKAPILAKRKTLAMKQRAEERAKVASKSAALAAKREKRRRFMRKPDVTHRAALERVLKKVATKGVVGLLNAIKAHQRGEAEVAMEATTKQKEGKVKLQDKFMKMLQKSAGAGQVMASSRPQPKASSGAQWGVLRDDYLMGAKMKDWNRVEHERNTEGAAGRGYDELQDDAWNAAGFDALGTDSEDEEDAGSAADSSGDSSDSA